MLSTQKSDVMEDTKEFEIIIRSLLIANPRSVNATELLKEYEENEGIEFPFEKLGFSSFVEYLKSIPSVVKLVPPDSQNPDVHPMASEKSMHMDLLVSNQKSDASKKSGFSRRRPASVDRSAGIEPLPTEQDNNESALDPNLKI